MGANEEVQARLAGGAGDAVAAPAPGGNEQMGEAAAGAGAREERDADFGWAAHASCARGQG